MRLGSTWKGKKERRKEYRGAKLVDKTCRNHGSCPYCRDNRTYSTRKQQVLLDIQEEDV